MHHPTNERILVETSAHALTRFAKLLLPTNSFVFKMGAERLDGYLYFQVEESIRTLVHSVKYDRVNDLRSEFSGEMLRTLQSKLSLFGVDVSNVKITDVALPRELQDRLEKTTSFRTRLEEEEKNHNFALQQLSNSHAQKMAEIKQKVNIEKQRLSAEQNRFEVEMDEKVAIAESERKVKCENAKGQVEVQHTKAKGLVEVATYQGRADSDSVVKSQAIQCEKDLRAARVQASKTIKVRGRYGLGNGLVGWLVGWLIG